MFGKCVLYAGKDLGKITSVTQQRKLSTDHPKKAFFTFIFATGISCDQIAKIIKTTVRLAGALATVGRRVWRALRKNIDKVRPLNSFTSDHPCRPVKDQCFPADSEQRSHSRPLQDGRAGRDHWVFLPSVPMKILGQKNQTIHKNLE